MTTMTTTRPQVSGNDRTYNADYLLGLPAVTQDVEALERDRARRAVERVAGEAADDILDMLGLTAPSSVATTRTDTQPADVADKFCRGCEQKKPRTDFARRHDSKDGLQGRCRDCQNAEHRAQYAQRGYRSTYEGRIGWKVAAPGGRGMPCSPDAVERRINAWADLRIEQDLTPRKAAERMEVSMRSARRYDRILKDRGLLPQTDASGRAVS